MCDIYLRKFLTITNHLVCPLLTSVVIMSSTLVTDIFLFTKICHKFVYMFSMTSVADFIEVEKLYEMDRATARNNVKKDRSEISP